LATVLHLRLTWWRQFHLWLAVVLGAPIAVVSAAGLPMSYWELTDSWADPAFYPEQMEGQVLDLGQLSAAALRAADGGAVASVYTPRLGGALHVTVEREGDSREYSVHRATGEVLGSRDFQSSFVARTYDLHSRLWLGDVGRSVIFALAASLLALTTTGAVLWWPRGRSVWGALALRLRKGRRLRDLHSLLGLYTLVPILLASATTPLLAWPAGSSSPAMPQASSVLAPNYLAKVERSVRIHQRALSLRSVSGLTPTGHVRVVAQTPSGEIVQLGLNRTTAQIELLGPPAGEVDVRPQTISLHTGEFGGDVGRLVFALSALIPLILWVTGLCWWVTRRRPKSASIGRVLSEPVR
jgi:uncharacterized iron-regulated membrane protein